MNRPFLLAAVFMLLALLPMFTMQRAIKPEGFGLKTFRSPVLQSEFLTTDAAVLELFGPENNAARQVRTRQMRAAHVSDNFFLLFYGLFLAAFAFLAFGVTKQRRFLFLIFLAAAAALADVFENGAIQHLTVQLDRGDTGFSGILPRLACWTWAKWLALGVWFGLAARFFWKAADFGRVPDWAGKLLAAVSLATLVLTLAAWLTRSPVWENRMAMCMSPAFGGLFIFCLLFRKRAPVGGPML